MGDTFGWTNRLNRRLSRSLFLWPRELLIGLLTNFIRPPIASARIKGRCVVGAVQRLLVKVEVLINRTITIWPLCVCITMQIRTQVCCISVSVAGDAWCQIRILCTCRRGSREKSRAPRRAAAALQVPEKRSNYWRRSRRLKVLFFAG